MKARDGALRVLLVLGFVGLGCDGCRRTVPGTDGGDVPGSDSDVPFVDSGPGTDGGTGVEICDNGISDDGDPFIDCDDFDCDADPACVTTVTIRDIQDPALRTAAMINEGDVVSLSGVVVTGVEYTATGDEKSFFVQETTGAPEYSGIFVFIPTGKTGMFPVAVGDIVNLTAEYSEFDGTAGPESVSELGFVSSVTIVSSGNPLPAHAQVGAADIATGGAMHEAYEGVLVDIGGVSVTNVVDATNGVFEVENTLHVDDFLFAYTLPGAGDTFTDLRGILTFNAFEQQAQLLPGSLADMVLVTAVAAVEPSPAIAEYGGTPLSLTARLNTPAAAGGQVVCLSSSDPLLLTVPAMVTVPAGTLTAAFDATAAAPGPGLVTVSATAAAACPAAPPADATAEVWVDAPGTTPAVIDLAPSPATVQLTLTALLTVTLDLAPPAGSPGVAVLLTSSDPAAVSAPAQVVVPAGMTAASFAVTGLSLGGSSTITASLNGGMATSLVTVTDITGTPVTSLVLSEVLYDVSGTDTGMEWIEIYNGGTTDADVSGWTIENGGTTYTTIHTFAPGTVITAGECFVLGPGAGTFSSDLQNSCSTTGTCAADGLLLRNAAAMIVDAVIYGPPGSNTNNLEDETGTPGTEDVDDAPADSSIERIGPTVPATTYWRVRPTAPSMGDCSIIM